MSRWSTVEPHDSVRQHREVVTLLVVPLSKPPTPIHRMTQYEIARELDSGTCRRKHTWLRDVVFKARCLFGKTERRTPDREQKREDTTQGLPANAHERISETTPFESAKESASTPTLCAIVNRRLLKWALSFTAP